MSGVKRQKLKLVVTEENLTTRKVFSLRHGTYRELIVGLQDVIIGEGWIYFKLE